MRCPVGSRSQGLRTVNPLVPEASLGNGFRRTFSSQQLAEPPNCNGHHHQAANSKSANPDDQDGQRTKYEDDGPDKGIAQEGGGHKHGNRHAEGQVHRKPDKVPKAKRTLMSPGRSGRR